MISSVFTSSKEPKLTLVGAGPGDPDLITLKAIKAIEAADIVLYDALVSDEILNMIPNGVPTLSVGKRAGQHSHSQDEINELIVEFAYLYGHVVRLKGGDPFVFGRGSEEIEFAELHGIKVQFVPGISSSLSVPASIGIPITARGVSESFWVVTGTTKNGEVSSDLILAAQSSATIVILMGLHKIQEIMDQFEVFGKGNVPVAVIQNGTLSNQRSVVGTVNNIVTLAKQEKIGAPAVIVVGEVVQYAKQLNRVLIETLEN